jgi:hypothetical protein
MAFPDVEPVIVSVRVTLGTLPYRTYQAVDGEEWGTIAEKTRVTERDTLCTLHTLKKISTSCSKCR